MWTKVSLVAAMALVCAGAFAQEWVDITPDAALTGWKALDGEWTVADGVVSGKLTKTPDRMNQVLNSWLLYEAKEFADFEIEFEFRTPYPTNGGVQFRTQRLPKTPLAAGGAPEAAPLECYGYQANIETRTREGTGKLIEENGRGTLKETDPAASKTLTQKGWNKMRVVARGNKIDTYLHDVLANSFEDEAYLGGYLLLQVHSDEVSPAAIEVQYRNIRIKDLGRDGNWAPLFDGTTLGGWKEWGSEKWTVQDGAILGQSGPKKSEGYLATERSFSDFRVRGAFKMLGEGNFGLFFHSTITLKEDGYPVIAGVQGEVEPAYPTKTGCMYESYKRGWLVEPDTNTPGAMALRRNDWNVLEIRSQMAEGGKQHLTSWLNGVRVFEWVDAAPNLLEGSFALQLHTGGVDGIAWKDLFILE